MPEIQVAQGHVATLITDIQIALNVGSEAGVCLGDTVTLSRSVEIIDPISKETLGGVLLAKLKLVVTMVSKKYCVATVTDRAPVGKSGGGFRPLKRVVNNPFTSDDDLNEVHVEIGEKVRVTRGGDDEPPF